MDKILDKNIVKEVITMRSAHFKFQLEELHSDPIFLD